MVQVQVGTWILANVFSALLPPKESAGSTTTAEGSEQAPEEEDVCFYTILNISENATNEEIRKAYKKASLKYHPDKVAQRGNINKEEAQQVIGKPHQSTIPAVKILEKEGFRYTGYVDIFDAGPSLEAPLNDIKTIKNSQLYTIRDKVDEVNDNNYFVANTKPRIRASIGNILVDEQNLTCILSHKLAELLEVTKGDQIRISQFT